jgi:hypothetical protein
MMLSGKTLRFPAERTLDFPPDCAVCGDDPRGETVRLGARTWSYMGLIPDERVELTIPACFSCGRRLLVKRWVRMGLFATALVGTVIFVYPQLDPTLRLRKILAIGAGFAAALVAVLLCEWLLPISIDVDPEDKGRTVELQVRDPAYVLKLLVRNPWVELVD